MPDIVSLRGRRGRTSRGKFSVEVDITEPMAMMEGLEIATSPFSLADWMRRDASPMMGMSLAEMFGDNGRGGIGGSWAPLQESTIRIKQALGVAEPEAANDRTQAMMEALVTDHAVDEEAYGSSMKIPGDVSDPVLARKIETAQKGYRQGSNDMLPGAYTPPRPVLQIDQTDTTALVVSLESHIMTTVAALMGTDIGGL